MNEEQAERLVQAAESIAHTLTILAQRGGKPAPKPRRSSPQRRAPKTVQPTEIDRARANRALRQLGLGE